MTKSSQTKNQGLSLGGAFRQISSLTAISRIAGFMRDITFASFLGAGPAADAFLVALKLPNMFRRLSAEGAMTNAFLPSFSKTREDDGRRAAILLGAEAQVFLILALFVLVIVVEIFMPQVIGFLAPGFAATPDRLAAAIDLARITMPYLPMISIVALWVAIANAHDRFMLGAAAPIITNICFIAGAVAIPFVANDFGVMRAFPVAIALLVAGLFQLLFLGFLLRRLGAMPPLIWPRVSAAGRRMWRSFVPSALGAGGMQINLLVDLILASLLPVGAISWLYYADRVAQLPLGIVGIALGTALLPRLSAAEAAGKTDQVTHALGDAIALAGFFVLPAVTALVIIAGPVIGGLFGYGAFSDNDTAMAAMALCAYAVGLPGFILVKILQTAFYATGQPGMVLKISVLTVVVNISGSLIMMPVLGHVGLALATSLSGGVAAIAMLVLLFKQNRLAVNLEGNPWLGKLARIFGASLIMAAVLAGLLFAAEPLRAMLPAAGWLAVLVTAGSVSYGIAALLFGALPRTMMNWLGR